MIVLILYRCGNSGVRIYRVWITPDFRAGCSKGRNTFPVTVEGEAGREFFHLTEVPYSDDN